MTGADRTPPNESAECHGLFCVELFRMQGRGHNADGAESATPASSIG